jgi:hypothetical protein
MFARFEIRRLNLAVARKILGAAIGMCPKEALFKGYIDLELEVSDSYHSGDNNLKNFSSYENLIECGGCMKNTSR